MKKNPTYSLVLFLVTLYSYLFYAQVYAQEGIRPYQVNIVGFDKDFKNTLCQKFQQWGYERFILNTVVLSCQQQIPKNIDGDKYEYQINVVKTDSGSKVVWKFLNDEIFERNHKMQWDLSPSATLKEYEFVFSKILDHHQYSKKYIDKTLKMIFPYKEGKYLVDQGRLVNRKIAVKELVKIDQDKHYFRASLEILATLGLAKVAYILKSEEMKADQDYENKTLNDYLDRFFTLNQVKYDDNSLTTNWGHSYAGYVYFSAARSNGLNFYESFLMTLAGSTIWEYVLENKEMISINDQIMTTFGGAVIGESLHQMYSYLDESDSIMAKIIKSFINPVEGLNDLFFTPDYASKGHQRFHDYFGPSAQRFNFFDAYAGMTMMMDQQTKESITLATLGLKGEVSSWGIDQPGQYKGLVWDTIMAQQVGQIDLSLQGEIAGIYTLSKIVLAGYVQKEMSEDQNGKKSGYSFVISPAMAAEYGSSTVGSNQYYYGVVHVLGGTLDATFYKGEGKIRFVLDLYADFAMLRPIAYDQAVLEEFDFSQANTLLRKREMTYSSGSTQVMRLEWNQGDWTVGAQARQSLWDSIDPKGFDRHPENVKKRVDSHDEIQSLKIYVIYDLSKTLSIEAFVEKISQQGSIDDHETLKSALHKSSSLIYYLGLGMKM